MNVHYVIQSQQLREVVDPDPLLQMKEQVNGDEFAQGYGAGKRKALESCL